MARKASKVDDFVDLVGEVRVADAIRTCIRTDLDTTIEVMFEKLSAKFIATVQQSLENFASQQVSQQVADATAPLIERISKLEEVNEGLNLRVDSLENSTRLTNLVIHGLPSNVWSTASQSAPDQLVKPDLLTDIIDLCNDKLGIAISASDITTAYRLPVSSAGRSQPVLVKFTSRSMRDRVFQARKSLRLLPSASNAEHIFFNEHLTKANAHIFSSARKSVREKKTHSAWTAGGLVFVRKSNSTDEKPKLCRTMKDLENLANFI